MNRIAQIAALCLLTTVALAQNPKRAANLIQPEDLKADLSFLASPDLAGRNSGSAEDHIATDFIASEFMRLGLTPVGDNGTFFQSFGIVTGSPDRQHTTLTATIDGQPHTYMFLTAPRQSIRNQSICGPVTFAGYGIDAPEYGYSDLSSTDLHGKVVIVISREPQANDPHSKFMGQLDTYHAFYWNKVEELRKRGAAAVLIVPDSDTLNTRPIPASSPRARGGPSYALDGPMWDVPVFTLRSALADQLLASTGKTIAALKTAIDTTLKPDSFDVPGSNVCVQKAYTDIQRLTGRNVVALLPGSDPTLKAQTIIVTAHHDHMGASNGHIFYGADDNASGVTGLLEIARAFVKGNIHPKRSVLFIAYDGEERIFLGSYFYVTHPIVPLAGTVANINMDMIGRNEDDINWPTPADRNVDMVNVLGTRYNPALRKVFAEANKQENLKLDYKMDTVDPDSLWSRSDHFWFATLHIPQVEFQTGLHPDYHTENDTWQRINYPKLTKIIRLVFLSTANLAASGQKVPFIAVGASPGP